MKALEDLKAAYAATPLGTVIARRPLDDDEPDGYLESDLDFLGNNLVEAAARIEGPLADLIDLMHNTLPALIGCAEMLEHLVEHGEGYMFSKDEDKARAALAKLETPPCATS